MILNFETRIKELEAKYQMSIDSNAIKRESDLTRKEPTNQLGDIGQETVKQQQQFFDPKNQ